MSLLTGLLQDGVSPLHNAAWGGHTACVEHLISTPGIDVNIKNVVSWSNKSNEYIYHFVHAEHLMILYIPC